MASSFGTALSSIGETAVLIATEQLASRGVIVLAASSFCDG
jgi:hypothetical protein